jgi:DnaK suppressor protein
MTRTELNRFVVILNAKQAELGSALGRRDGIAIERTPDALDEVQLSTEREFKTRSLERESQLLGNVRDALNRIAEGDYGTCLQCEEEISQKRLQAVPWATLCISCQEHADRSPHPRFAAQPRFLMDAA